MVTNYSEKFNFEEIRSKVDKIEKFDFDIRVMHTTELEDFHFLFDMVWYDIRAGITISKEDVEMIRTLSK